MDLANVLVAAAASGHLHFLCSVRMEDACSEENYNSGLQLSSSDAQNTERRAINELWTRSCQHEGHKSGRIEIREIETWQNWRAGKGAPQRKKYIGKMETERSRCGDLQCLFRDMMEFVYKHYLWALNSCESSSRVVCMKGGAHQIPNPAFSRFAAQKQHFRLTQKKIILCKHPLLSDHASERAQG